MTTRIAIVLFNLGGPDSLDAVRPFLFNLFNDPAIIGLPAIARTPLAWLISKRREKKAQGIYALMGGRSPILPNTEAQAKALMQALASETGAEFRAFIAMRYWHPFTAATVKDVKDFAPDQIVLLPLYPQFSTTTTQSSYRLWMKEAAAQGLTAPTRLVCCWPTEPGFIAAAAAQIDAGLAQARHAAPAAKPLVILSAHGLPKKIVDAGDPYVTQVEASAAEIVLQLGLAKDDWIISYQSRVGPLEWVGPATDAVIEQAAKDGRALVVFPIAFVSEHSETLVELDIEYRHLAEHNHAPAYIRVPTVGTHPAFIAGLAGLVRQALAQEGSVQPGSGQHVCGAASGCACRVGAA
ncbi:MAG TPA: ferrochelatase [Dongiaceae bacterium]|nr:ferrochelatase [Dongiaceae bacterium]